MSSMYSGSSKRQRPHRPTMFAVTPHEPPDLLERPTSTFLPLVRIEGVTGSHVEPNLCIDKVVTLSDRLMSSLILDVRVLRADMYETETRRRDNRLH